jgi:epsin
MEAKVREATNNDHWGASSTLLLEISKATYTFQQFNEVMPLLYRRINESQGSWRETYKTLQLIDYLLKNGAEQVIENVRDHLYEIKSLTNYQFTDEKGKDQGINGLLSFSNYSKT